MSKKFRFYTLEELVAKYHNRLCLNTAGFMCNNVGGGTLHIKDLGTTIGRQGVNENWMGEEVIEKPINLVLECRDYREDTLATEIRDERTDCVLAIMNTVDNMTNTVCLNIDDIGLLRDKCTEVLDYLEQKEK